jgi:peptidoglycan/LPS O-acetylase OafA/YrhL
MGARDEQKQAPSGSRGPDARPLEKARQRRGDIQGMRAVAVLLVMLDHAGIPGLAGGYLGVDVFFVISGFLITGILVREVRRTGRVSIADFYARRARRILPAASLVLVAVVLASSQLYSYLRINEVMTDVTWAAFFAANIHLALSGSDYFAATSFVSPVQHFWSLAVEEQFYLVWPPLIALIMLTWRKAGRESAPDPSRTVRRLRILTMAIAMLCGLSLAWSVWRTTADPGSAYFSTLARGWELGAGALLALGAGWVSRLPVAVKFIASWTGLAAIAAATATYSSATPFPGYHALLPVLGAVLVLAGGTDGPRYGAALVLDRLPMRWIGDISYSLYLWHWPFLVMPVVYLGRELRLAERVALMAGAMVVSALSYWFVETPVRRASLLSRNRLTALVMWPATAAVLIAAVSVVQAQYGHSPAAAAEAQLTATVGPGSAESTEQSRDPVVNAIGTAAELARTGSPLPRELKPSLDELFDDVSRSPGKCGAGRDDTTHEICELGDTDADRTIVLFGDSHIGMWLEPLLRAAKTRGWKLVPITKASCLPVDVTEWRPEKARPYTECDTWRQWAYGEIAKLKPDRVIISGYLSLPFADAESRKPISVKDTGSLFAEGAKSALKRLRQSSRNVYVIGGTPTLSKESGDCLADRRATMASCAGPVDQLVEQRNRAWKKEADAAGAHWVDVVPWFCDQRTCPLVVGNVIVYRDTNHITRTYSTAIGDALVRRLGL